MNTWRGVWMPEVPLGRLTGGACRGLLDERRLRTRGCWHPRGWPHTHQRRTVCRGQSRLVVAWPHRSEFAVLGLLLGLGQNLSNRYIVRTFLAEYGLLQGNTNYSRGVRMCRSFTITRYIYSDLAIKQRRSRKRRCNAASPRELSRRRNFSIIC